MGDYLGLCGWAINAFTNVLIKGRKGRFHTKEKAIGMIVEIRVMQSQVMECQQPPEDGTFNKNSPSSRASGRSTALLTS